MAGFTRLAIVNRGEPAMRLIHAVHELNQRRADPIRLIALFTESERDAMFVRYADEAVCIGPSLIDDGDGGQRSGYLDLAALERALLQARADAAWVGWGCVAEQPEFAELCDRLGIAFIGPDAAVMRVLADGVAAGRLAASAGVNVAFAIGLEAPAGAGPADQPATPTRRIQVQVIADGQGGVWVLGVRDCTYRRGHEMVLAESASPALTAEQERDLAQDARRLMVEAGYRNAGTVEFVLDSESGRFLFLRVCPRLQVAHAVTEAVTGVDLVKLQLHVAEGGRLVGDPPAIVGHAIEARLGAEDAALGFAAAPGRIALLRLPTGPGVRVDTGVAEGDVLPPEFDSLIGKLIAWGRDRDEALARLHKAVSHTLAVIEGGTTNQGFLLELLDRPEVRRGEAGSAWLDRLFQSGEAVPVRHGDIALLQAAIEYCDDDTAADRARFYAFARRGRAMATTELARAYDLRHRGQAYRALVAQLGPDRHRVTIDGAALELVTRRLGPYERRLELAGAIHRTVVSRQGDDLLVEVDGVPHRISRGDVGTVRNLSPAVVVSIPVAVGDRVEAGDVVAIVEAMKMESSLTAPFRGVVAEVHVGENVHVTAQSPLVTIEPIRDGAPAQEPGARQSFAALPTVGTAPASLADVVDRMRCLVLGYDIDRAETDALVASLRAAAAELGAAAPELLAAEDGLLEMFADLCAVTSTRRADDSGWQRVLRSPQERFHMWLSSLDPERERLPASFSDDLRAALRHYGVDDLERTPALERACHRLFLAGQRSDAVRALALAILDRRLQAAGRSAGPVSEAFAETLDRLLVAPGGRDPVIGDLARELRFRYVDGPVIASAREPVYAEMGRCVAALRSDPDRADREDLIAAIVDCPRPLAPLLTQSMAGASPAALAVLVEAMTRRYYRVRTFEPFRTELLGGYAFLLGRYVFEGQTRHHGAAYIQLEDVAAAAAVFVAYARTLPAGEPVVLDLYAAHDAPRVTRVELAAQLRTALRAVEGCTSLHRVVVAVADHDRGRGMRAVDLFTFRPSLEGLVEDVLVRGMHPMMGHRLKLWRLAEFELDRLPSAEDVYLFHGVGRSNPADERLFALAEVRDLTAVRDERGRVVALPELEQALIQVFEAIREFQAHRPLSRRLMWNRVVLHAWPVWELASEEIRTLMERIVPLSAGLGLELLEINGRIRDERGLARERVLRFFAPTGRDVAVEVSDAPTKPLRPLDESARRLIAARRRGTLHPAEVARLLAPARASATQPAGTFTEYELDDDGRLVPVDRPPASNPTGIVVGTVRNYTARHPEGMLRVILLGDPTRALGSLAAPECRRINAAIDLATELGVPLEWFALSAGAKIAMDSGTETMDWIAAVLRRIILFTQAGGEINVVVAGINVGAQPYFNAEATMLMHTRGALIMTPDSAMVLTGKQAIDYSGGVSADDNFGIGGYERIMGPNGQAQYWAPDLAGACRVLLDYYDHTYVARGERFPRRAQTTDPISRDAGASPHAAPGSALTTVAEVFSDATNPERKQPFDIRSVMRAVIDADRPPLERWGAMADAEASVVWDAHLGGWPVAVLGIESRPLPRRGQVPADGPDSWTSGTLFPRSAKKIARAINATGGRRPIVVLANLAGFDASPESMRECQLEFGAEIGRAVVNYDGPIVFCVVSRYHGGAFVVFSQLLNSNLETLALEGARASVIGGAPAAAVVFNREVEQTAAADERVVALDKLIAEAEGAERQRLRGERAILWGEVLARTRGEFAERFDAVHSVERAVEVGSVKRIITLESIRQELLDAVERGMARAVEPRGPSGDDTGDGGLAGLADRTRS